MSGIHEGFRGTAGAGARGGSVDPDSVPGVPLKPS